MTVELQTNLADEALIITTAAPTALDVLELALIEMISSKGVDPELVIGSIESAAAEAGAGLPPAVKGHLAILLNTLAAAGPGPRR